MIEEKLEAIRLRSGLAPPAGRGPAPAGKRGQATPWLQDTHKAEPRPAVPLVSPTIGEVARSYLSLRAQPGVVPDQAALENWSGSISGDGGTARLLRDLHRTDPSEALRVARNITTLPEPGQTFLGFRLIDELGRGAFGRVYLAQQGDLADRYVALKVSTELKGESQTLAQLQHTNIVPIFSVHHAEPFQAVCMPYFGMTTLKDVCEDLKQSGLKPASGQSLLKKLSTRRSSSKLPSTRRRSGPTGPSGPSAARSPGAPEAVVEAAKAADSPEPDAPDEQASDDGAAPAGRDLSDTLRMIGELPYDNAVLWMGSRLADGLAHAHDRGILHRDLKPANILLTDDGQPMILDFNLSEDIKPSSNAAVASVGGTLPYMSPEHLAAFRDGGGVVDARSDLYALGIILYELLAHRHPFPIHDDSSSETLGRMIAERQGPPPKIRPWNAQVSPAAESIIRHCLEADPARRYQSVRDLREDLERHLANRPLRHAPEPSLRERIRKFGRRNPRLGFWFGIGIALVALASTASVQAARGHRLAQLEAARTRDAFRDDFGTARYVLSVRSEDRAERDRGTRIGREALGRYGVLDNPAWAEGPAVAVLPLDDRDRLRHEVGEALSILAEAAARDASERPGAPGREGKARDGVVLSGLALACFEGAAPRSLLSQRAVLLQLVGRRDEGKALQAQADRAPMQTARDFLMAATDRLVRGEPGSALPLAEEAARRDPANFWAWFTRGVCLDRLERPAQALACFQTCVALRPDDRHSWFNRGVSHLRNAQHAAARADFDRAIELKPDWSEPFLNRAQARSELGDHRGAADDLTKALERGATETRIFFLRSRALAAVGDAEAAVKDLEAGLAKAPIEAQSWVERGLQRMNTDPAAALADFEQASELEPTSLRCLHMRAHILALAFRRLDDAVPILDRAIALYPDYVPARTFRGVVRAVQGQRDAAIKDAEESRWRDSSPANLYQLAGLYATTSKQVPEDRDEAFQLLHSALRRGFGFDLIEGDRELDPIRDRPEFRRLLESARIALKAKAPAKASP